MFPQTPRGLYYPDWITTCCGFGGSGARRRDYELARSYFYSPSTAHLDHAGNRWPMASVNPYAQPQPYLLLTQPVIIANNPTSGQLNTMTLVQHAQAAGPQNPATFHPALSIMGQNPTTTTTSQQRVTVQPNIISSQYAIYNSSAALDTNMMLAPSISRSQNIFAEQPHLGQDRTAPSQSNYLIQNKPYRLPIAEAPPAQKHPERKTVTLSSEIFRQLELIEKQVDLSKDMDLIEVHGIVITRALDPYSLMPHLTEAHLRRYNSHFLFNDDYVIRFIEIIKRPGQTLGLYIRTVHFEDSQSGRSRAGVVITKIDSDSPIYNSQVLHVGDEIISINLVDIQSMSLDDVVIMMSIPKRLVLAIRIPRDRDQLLSMNLMQQQQLLRNSINQQLPERNWSFQQQQQLLEPQAMPSTNISIGNNQRATQSIVSDVETSVQDPDVGGSYADTARDEIRREMSWRILDQDQENCTRPERVQSALQMNELLSGCSREESNNPHNSFDCDLTRRYNSQNQWQPMHRTLPARPNFDRLSPVSGIKQPIISNLRLGDTPEQSSYFSSSIDAINRELKELRKQRIALSNNEHNMELTRNDV